MASPSDGHDGKTGGVEFLLEAGGRITARDTETGTASYGEPKAEAVRMLAEALELHDGGGEPVSEDDLQELGLDRVREEVSPPVEREQALRPGSQLVDDRLRRDRQDGGVEYERRQTGDDRPPDPPR